MTKLEKLRESRSQGGFTLVELLIVIVVLGVLAGITVFGVATFRTDATTAACNASKKTVEVAVDAYNAKTGTLPADIAALVTANYIESAPAGLSLGTGGVVTGTCTAP